MSTIEIACVLASLILAVVVLARTKGRDLLAWALALIAIALVGARLLP